MSNNNSSTYSPLGWPGWRGSQVYTVPAKEVYAHTRKITTGITYHWSVLLFYKCVERNNVQHHIRNREGVATLLRAVEACWPVRLDGERVGGWKARCKYQVRIFFNKCQEQQTETTQWHRTLTHPLSLKRAWDFRGGTTQGPIASSRWRQRQHLAPKAEEAKTSFIK